MSNLAIALALIMSRETSNMDCSAVGDLHLPPGRQSYGRMAIRRTVLDDLNEWDNGSGIRWTREDSMNPNLDVLIAARWLRHYCGDKASVARYAQCWNCGWSGRNGPQARAYYRACLKVKRERPGYYAKCVKEIRRIGVR